MSIIQDGLVPINIKINFLSRVTYIGSDAVTVFVYLCSRSNKNGESYPSFETMSSELNIGKNQCVRAVDKLEFLEYISINKNFHRANHYFIMPGIDNDIKFLTRYAQYVRERNSVWYAKNSKKKKSIPAAGHEHI